MLEEKFLPGACVSPRISGGVLKWYAGDVFDLQVRLELTDENGEAVQIAPAHRVTFVFRDSRRKALYQVDCMEIEDNLVVLRFTEAVTALFPKGAYTYDVIYKGAVRRTLVSDGPILVE